jgi:cytochrome P450
MTLDEQVSRSPAGCPVLEGFDPLVPAQVTDPYPWYDRARDECPVFLIPRYGLYCVTRYADAVPVLRDPALFSSSSSTDYVRPPMPPEIVAEVGEGYASALELSMVVKDPPEHTRLRKLLNRPLTAKALAVREPRLREIANRLVDGFAHAGRTDLMGSFASPFIVTGITDLFGVPQDSGMDWRAYTVAVHAVLSGGLPEDAMLAQWKTLTSMDRWIKEFVAARRADPQDDLTSQLVHSTTEDGEPQLTDTEVWAALGALIGAGADTTAVLLCHLIHQLDRNPDVYAEIRADRSLIPAAIEEALRHQGAAGGVIRFTTADTVIGGIPIAEGSKVYVPLKSLNRDPEVFDDPERFDIHRPNLKQHMALGTGVHTCIGAHYGRLEARVGMEVLLDRLPDLRVCVDQGPLEYTSAFTLPALRKLDVEWDPR